MRRGLGLHRMHVYIFLWSGAQMRNRNQFCAEGAGESSVEARRHAPPEEDRAEQLRGASECDRGGRLRGASEDPEDADEGDLERVTVRQGGGGRQGGEAVHHGIRCDMCSEGPIRGSRYQSKAGPV